MGLLDRGNEERNPSLRMNGRLPLGGGPHGPPLMGGGSPRMGGGS